MLHCILSNEELIISPFPSLGLHNAIQYIHDVAFFIIRKKEACLSLPYVVIWNRWNSSSAIQDEEKEKLNFWGKEREKRAKEKEVANRFSAVSWVLVQTSRKSEKSGKTFLKLCKVWSVWLRTFPEPNYLMKKEGKKTCVVRCYSTKTNSQIST